MYVCTTTKYAVVLLSYPACSSSSIPMCLDTVFNDPKESPIASKCSSCCLVMYCCCDNVSFKNWRWGLSKSFSNFEYLVVPWLLVTLTGLLSNKGLNIQNYFSHLEKSLKLLVVLFDHDPYFDSCWFCPSSTKIQNVSSIDGMKNGTYLPSLLHE